MRITQDQADALKKLYPQPAANCSTPAVNCSPAVWERVVEALWKIWHR